MAVNLREKVIAGGLMVGALCAVPPMVKSFTDVNDQGNNADVTAANKIVAPEGIAPVTAVKVEKQPYKSQ